MKVINSITRRDVTGDYIRLLEGKITNAEFEVIAGVDPKENILYKRANKYKIATNKNR